jgi:mRNA interferase MazF
VFYALLDPTQGSEQAGARPVIIISRDAINHNSSVVICVPVTDLANCNKIYPSQILLKAGTGGLKVDSVAMGEQIRAITVDRLKDRIGTLDRGSLHELGKRLKIALDLD